MSKKRDEQKVEETPVEVQTEEVVNEPSELDKLKELSEDYRRKWYLVSAEYDNYRKRNNTAVSEAYKNGVSDAVLKILPVADNFGYALDSASDEKTRTGIDKVIKSFLAILS